MTQLLFGTVQDSPQLDKIDEFKTAMAIQVTRSCEIHGFCLALALLELQSDKKYQTAERKDGVLGWQSDQVVPGRGRCTCIVCQFERCGYSRVRSNGATCTSENNVPRHSSNNKNQK